MLVHEQYRKSVAFLCLRDPEVGWRPVGSGFFLAVAVSANEGLLYLVTARHVIEGAHPFGSLFVRVNSRDSDDAAYREITAGAWYVSEETDVAVVQMSVSFASAFDIQWLSPTQVATREVLIREQVGPGDEVFFPGLFTSYPGVNRAEPVIRFGNISMMPNEPGRTRICPTTPSRSSFASSLATFSAEERSR